MLNDTLADINQDEHLKYTMWSNYVDYWRIHHGGRAPLTYFAWLDRFGLS